MGDRVTNYEFEGFRLDVDRHCLWHADKLVPLTPKAFATLKMLVENSGEIVDKNDLLDEVWADAFVEESTVSQNILTIRKTLKSFESGADFIGTVPRRGYRFIAPVTKTNGAAPHPLNGNGSGAAPRRAASDAVPASNGRLMFVGMLVGLVFVTAVGLAFYLNRPVLMTDTRFREFRVAELFSDSNIKAAAISPDGRYLALTERQGDKEKLTVRQLNGSNAIETVPPGSNTIASAIFSPNSDSLYFTEVHIVDGGRLGELYRVPVLGGAPQLIASDVDSPPSLSAGKLTFVRRRPQQKETSIILSDIDGKDPKVLATRSIDEGFQNSFISPDGRFVASAVNTRSPDRPMELVLTNAETGEQRPMSEQSWLWVGQIAWLPDSSGVVLVGYPPTSPDLTDEVWSVSLSDGRARMLEHGIDGAFGVSLTGDGSSIVAVKSDKVTSLAVASLSDLSKATVIDTKAGDRSLLPLDADWITADRIVYATTENGNADIWSMNADGTDRHQLTADKAADLGARVSPDGKYLYFLSNRSGKMAVWRSGIDGSQPRQLSNGADAFSVGLSPDGKTIYYTERAGSIFGRHLWRAAADGSDPVELTQKMCAIPSLSPDGKTIACYYPVGETRNLVLTLLDAQTGAVIKQFPDQNNDSRIEWQRDGKSLWLVSYEGADSVLWEQPLDGPAAKIYTWPNETLFRIAISPLGDRLFFEKGIFANHVVMLNDRPGR